MKLTTEEKLDAIHDLLTAIVNKVCPEVLQNKPAEKVVKTKRRKPFSDAICYDDIRFDQLDSISIVEMAKRTAVSKNALEGLATAIGIKCLGVPAISGKDAQLIWLTYCQKRKW